MRYSTVSVPGHSGSDGLMKFAWIEYRYIDGR